MAKQIIKNPRAMMEQAISVMMQSVAEGRGDGKVSPLVGAVLVKPTGPPAETAYRGELREGDHAEFTILERKNRDQNLEGSVLFATLEPCAPKSRNHPKLGCAERIVNARIKDVWVGIEDPDPTVDRKGIKYLQDNGVTVHMFDRDLQDKIREANRDFIAQAMERKRDSKKKPVSLSPLEHAATVAHLDDLSSDALKEYQSLIGIGDEESPTGFHRRLLQQGLLVEKDGGLVPTGFGLLLFGKSPRDSMPQAGLLGTIHYEDGTEEPRDFDGPMVKVPDAAIQWLKDKLPNPIDRTTAQRQEANQQFYELVREGIVNALVHRDYDLPGAKCHLVVSDNIVSIKSPGEPVSPITVEQLQSFNAPMLSRNPTLHYVFAKMKLAEERGLGLKSLRTKAGELGLPLPTFTFEDPYLVLTLYRTSVGLLESLPADIREGLAEDEQSVLALVAGRGATRRTDIEEELGFDERKAQRVLKRLQELGLVRRVGSGPSTRYELD